MNPIHDYIQKWEPNVCKVGPKKFEENKFDLVRCLMASNDAKDLQFSLDYFVQLNNGKFQGVEKTMEILSYIVFIYLKLEDYSRAVVCLNDWVIIEPDNEEIYEVYLAVKDKSLKLAKKQEDLENLERKLEILEKEKASMSSYFTIKIFLILGLALGVFSLLRDTK